MITVCGEALLDLVPAEDSAETFRARPGGSCANTAVALARLGTPVTMLARLSADGFGDQLRRHLAGNGVDLSRAVAASEPSSVALAGIGADGGASYRFLVEGTADWAWTDAELGELPAGTVALHTGSLAVALAPGAAAIERLMARSRPGATICLDPNIRADLIPDMAVHRRILERLLRLCDLVKVSREDLAAIYPGGSPDEAARGWLAQGPALVVVTDGAAGAAAWTARGRRHVPASPLLEVVDTIGAGDTFTAGLLDWLHRAGRLGGRLGGLEHAELDAALLHAGDAAAVTCSRPGADPPWRAELPVRP